MQIVNYELFAVPPRWLLLKLETDEGVVGWGEPIVQGRLETVRTAVSELVEEHLLNEDPLRTTYHWRKLYQSAYFRGGPVLMSALSGIDQALWDIKGRYYDVPVHQLLGGHVRDRMLVYKWMGGNPAEEIAQAAIQCHDQGYRAFKTNLPHEFYPLATPARIDQVVEQIAALRNAVGDEALVGFDFHGRVSKPMAHKLINRLESYDLAFIDQPLPPEQIDGFKALSDQTTIPLATGERLYSRYDFKQLLVDGGVSIIQPDVSHVGGITEMWRLASMAEAFDVAVVPHCPLGPVALAASLQVGFCSQNVVLQEQDLDVHDPESSQWLAYLDDPKVFDFQNGYIERLIGPGLGIEIDEDVVREKAQTRVNWHSPIWHHEDGSLAEW
ncbi:galactonate dehydratase [Halogranum rubrum]|uniref:Mandelate racemase/muconate lactonizing family protein n=1 Tax=Halogranum salarium B-1 TaxID=1210908 RepID=J3ETM9_9EURY|nr:galactonate dehydratase [Halogranum salarium]EJN57542.1 mandelate racemase/muconate lactonizing family protein [Halogranum salarium B-1]